MIRTFIIKYLLMMLFVIPLLGIGFSVNAQQDSCDVSLSSNATTLNCNYPEVIVIASGSVDSMTYEWSNGQISDRIMASAPGSYYVTAATTNGCTASASIDITEDFSVPNVSITSLSGTTMLTCSTTQIMLTAEGNAEMYSWSNGSTSQNLIVDLPGAYTVTVMGVNGCTASASIDIMGSTESPVISVSAEDILCHGASDGSATAFVIGGTEPYTYNWSTIYAQSSTVTGLSAGIYTVTVTDFNGCTASAQVELTEPNEIMLMINGGSTICYGESATLNAIANGGFPNYSYMWNNGEATASITVSPTETTIYSVTVTDYNACSAAQEVFVTVSTPLEISMQADSLTFSNPTANIEAMVFGGAPPYIYTWSNGSTANSIQVSEAGTYSVTVVDSYGCSASEYITLDSEIDNEPPCIGCDSDNIDPFDPTAGISCSTITGTELSPNEGASTYTHNGSDWDITATDNVGIASIVYSLSGATNTITGSNTTLDGQIFEIGLTTVTWTVTDLYGNFSDCSFTVNVRDNEPPAINGNNLDRELTSNSCNFIVPDFTEEIRAISSDNTTQSNDLVITQTPSAGYVLTTTTTVMVTVSDQYGNNSSVNITLTIPAPPMVALSADNIMCYGATGSITATVTSGVAPYSFSWSNGSNSQSIGNVSAGTYSLTITDGNGCTATEYVTIEEPGILEISLNASSNTLTCANTEANIMAAVVGGTVPYTYTWSNGETSSSIIANAAGIYSVTATDANGCNATTSVMVDEDIAAPIVTISNNSGTEVLTCATTSINVVATSNNATSYMWSDGVTTAENIITAIGSYFVTATGSNGCTSDASIIITGSTEIPILSVSATDIACHGGTTTADAMVDGGTAPYNYQWSNGSNGTTANLSAGSYIVTVTDANACTATASIAVSEPEELVSTISSTSITCYGANDGSATVIIMGGTAPYSYMWSDGSTMNTIENAIAGVYAVTVVDANGCSAVQNITITEPEALVVNLTAGTISCAEPTTTINSTVMGGTAPYSYLWSDGSTMNTIENALEGVYFVTVVDANGCSASANVEIEGVSGIVATMATIQNAQNVDMANGAAYIIVNGGMAPYRVALSQNGNATSYEYVYMTSDFAINNLPAATYSLAITDANGCVANLNFVIENICNVSVAEQVTDSGTMLHFENVLYPVTVYVDGNTNGIASEDGYMLQNVENGVHNVFVADANGCFANISVFVEGVNCDNVNIMANVAVTPTTSTTNPNGTAVVTVEGGEAPYSFTWSNGNIGDNATDLYQGVYTIVVTDANGCVGTTSFEVTYNVPEEEFDELYVTLDYHLEMEQTYTDEGLSVIPVAVVYAQAFGGSAPYAYSWMAAGADNGCYFKMYESGSVCVEVRDEQNNAVNGCIFVDVPVVNEEVSNEIVEEVSQAVDSCFDARFVKAQVLEYEIDTVNNDCVVTWELFDVNGNIHNIDIAYPLDSALSGIYAFNLYFTCNGGRLVTSFSVRLYIEVEGGDPVSVEEIVVSSANAYPNPFTDIINVEIESAVSEDVEISVVNLSGQVVYMTNKHLSAGQNSFGINADNYVSGVYFIRINGSEINETLKMVK